MGLADPGAQANVSRCALHATGGGQTQGGATLGTCLGPATKGRVSLEPSLPPANKCCIARNSLHQLGESHSSFCI